MPPFSQRFQSTYPAQDKTSGAPHVAQMGCLFQSTYPHGVQTLRSIRELIMQIVISIHVPARGTTANYLIMYMQE